MSGLIVALVDGHPAQSLPLADRSLHYGDGVFETLEYCDGQVSFWSRHLQRLQDGCERIGLARPDEAQLRQETTQLVQGHRAGVLKIIISAGEGGRGYQRSHNIGRRILMLFPALNDQQQQQHGIRLHTCNTLLGHNTALAGIKHLNRLEQIMAKRELPSDCAEGLMLDEDEWVIEGIMSNVFCIQGRRLLTPRLTHCGVNGIIRNAILEVAPKVAMQVQEISLRRADLLASEEFFVCNSLIHIWSVMHWEKRHDWQRKVTDELRMALNTMIKQHAITLQKGSTC